MCEVKPQALVWLGVMVFKEIETQVLVLLGKRRGAHAAGEYAFPGGKLDYLEGFEECVLRKIKEECGANFLIKKIIFQSALNLIEYAPYHFVHFGYTAEWRGGTPHLCLPEKCEGWKWYDINKLPEPLFAPCKKMVESYLTGKIYFGDV
ncbi:MAG: hypothetical protein COW88_02905 [Candidatus Lloydbacteria bacterium CG22_combo_CG10-13_8_21_14_all_47_15]|uniref:Nudix hydrolase domain-containing protein n=1 Tax=Candidatus Lloydbacteria bacterium CG22_combo_CG10-13_8_21_14_all_47_15 TaxID=1974635 RepID=A0A2H0CTA3_9BACT|nr:MAG: hypothetical protein COW88_02905 [Candidatus Lloydbacteria bacterium CG22_combo_CG10-13_8_21_14_all_47_15]